MWIRHNDTFVNLEQVAGCRYDWMKKEIRFPYQNGYIKFIINDEREAHEILDNLVQVVGAKNV